MHDLLDHRQPAARFAWLRPAAYLRSFLILALILALLGIAPARAAGPATLLRDFALGASSGWTSAMEDFEVIGSTLYFTASDPANGLELWKSDGTAAGTHLVKDIQPGPQGSVPHNLTNVQGTLFFIALDTDGGDLWKSDGTPEGTVAVTNLPRLEGAVGPVLNVGGMLYFFAVAPPNPLQRPYVLMRSDGTPGGTMLLKEEMLHIVATPFQDMLFFANGGGLWKTDGTPEGMVAVKDIGAITPNDTIRSLIEVDGTLFFTSTVYDPNAGAEPPFITKLWKSDGTPEGTVLLKQINTAKTYNWPEELTNVNGTLFFVGFEGANTPELWKSDGTPEGTVIVKDINQDPETDRRPNGPYNLTNIDGTLFFTYINGANGGAGELWKSDGTEAGTVRVREFPSPSGSYNAPTDFVQFNGSIFFITGNLSQSSGIWKTDGTTDGTVLLKDVSQPDDGVVWVGRFVVLNGALIFVTTQGTGKEIALWQSDGTAAGTTPITWNPRNNGSTIINMTDVNGTLFFAVDDGRNGVELWKSDGTPQGTVLVKDINPGPADSYPSYLTAVGGTLFFRANDGWHGEELWRSDGTAAGTRLVSDIVPGAYSFTPLDLTSVNGTLFFISAQVAHSRELWKSDGTREGTVMVKQIPSDYLSFLDGLTNRNGTLLFLSGDALWKSDGTAAGTVALKTVYTRNLALWERPSTNKPIVINDTFFFIGSDTISNAPYGPFYTNTELWKSDGTPEGTVMVKDIVSPGSARISSLTDVGGTLFFAAADENHFGLWKSDGTAEGTLLVKENLIASSLTNANGTLFFSGLDNEHGRQLWKSDGTTAGTAIVKVLQPGLSDRDIQPIVQARPEGGVLFAAPTLNRGVELWQSDGTAEGTILLQDFAPGPGSSNPAQMLAVGNTIFLTVDEPSAGRELWALDWGVLGAMPLARDMLIGTRPDEAISGTLAGILPDGAAATYTIVANGSNGVVTITDPATGAFTYTPAQGAGGRDSFTFKVNDGSRESNIATVTVVFWTSFSSLPLIRR